MITVSRGGRVVTAAIVASGLARTARYSRPTRLAGLTHRFLGPHGSPRRARLLQLPLIGLVLRAGSVVHWGSRRFVERRQLELERAWIDFRNRHARTAPNITRRNTRRAYERVYGDDRLLGEYLEPSRVGFYGEVAAVAAALHPRSVLDVGCGTGHLLHEVVERVSPGRVVGIDYARAGVRRAAELVPAGEFRTLSLYDLELGEEFDLVLCTEVLEHLAEPQAAVERLVRHCAPSGTVLITVPDGASDSWEGHLNFWTEAELAEFLQPLGDVEVRSLGSELLALLSPA